MHKKIFFLFATVLLSGVFTIISAQPAEIGISANLASGEVKSISEGKLTVKTKDGDIDVILSAATTYKKIPPGPVSLKNAVDSSLTEISVGDKIMVTGLVAADKKSMPGKGVYLMTKADNAQRQTADADKWRTRGISGRVVSVNQLERKITIAIPRITGNVDVIVTVKDNAEIKRFPQGSYNYNDAKSGSIAEIQPRDEFRAYGERGADGTTFTAEGVLSGASAQVTVGTVKSVDVAKNEVIITDDQTKKDITVAIGPSTLYLKKYPAELVMRMGGMQGGTPGTGGPTPPGQSTGPTPPGQSAGPNPPGRPTGPGGPGPGGPGMGGGRGNINDILERAPSITLADLAAGEMVAIVTASKPAENDKVNAIKLVSGVEPLIAMQRAAGAAGGGQRGGQGGVNGSFTIPGLDGFGGP